MNDLPYNAFSNYLKDRYGCRVYKTPVSIPCGCPNRDGACGRGGCIFCGDESAGFETLENNVPVAGQLQVNMGYIGSKYKADKFIAYFQNYSNTYLDFDKFKSFMEQSCVKNVVALYISTRPDCVEKRHAEFLAELSLRENVDIVVEMGLQSVSDETLLFLKRGHTAQSFFDSASMLKSYGIGVCAHMISDIPVEDAETVERGAVMLSDAGIEQVKCHSLYVLKDTELGRMYENGEIEMLECGDFIERTILFLRNLDRDIVVQRLTGRAPEKRTLFCNFGRSWRSIVDEIVQKMNNRGVEQGDLR